MRGYNPLALPQPIQHLYYHHTKSNEKLEILKQKEWKWEKRKENNYIETEKNFWEDKETYLTNESENKVVDGDISI